MELLIVQAAQIDFTAIISSSVMAFISIGVTWWVWRGQNNIITEMRNSFNEYKKESKDKIEKLETKVKELEKSENEWFKKYHTLKVLIIQKGCKQDCKIKNALDELLAKEGEIA